MTELQKSAGLHESTVQSAADHVARYVKPKVKGRRRPNASPVRAIKVDPRVMAAALKLAKGDATRLEIRDAATVIVR